jgi:5-methylcytosine-specific restriction endonuclease McrA
MSKGSARGSKWRRTREQVLAEAGYACVLCGGTEESTGEPLTADHKIPRSEGGTDELDNLQCLCAAHNRNKGTKLITRIDWKNTKWLQTIS